MRGTRAKDTYHIGIIYPADPVGIIPGGIDTFIRGILKWAPSDMEMHLVGVSTDVGARPVRRWTQCDLGRRTFWFYPAIKLATPGTRSKIPLSLRFTAALVGRGVGRSFDVIDFHRLEPSLLYLFDRTPKNIVIHQNMAVLKDAKSDIRWKRAPRLFHALEDWLLPRMHSLFSVREDAVEAYQRRYPALADRMRFIPTWMDPDLFYPAPPEVRRGLKEEQAERYRFSADDLLVVSVGRLDHQKDPLLQLAAFAEVLGQFPSARLVMVGDGILCEEIVREVEARGLGRRVILTGLRAASEVADLLRVADVFLLSSAYEGMPMCVLEALGCGVPVATTKVGEVQRVVRPGHNGEIAVGRTTEAMARALLGCCERRLSYAGRPCTEVAANYVPGKVLAPFYANYRRIAEEGNGKAL